MDKRYLKEHIGTFECYLENHFLDGHRSFDYIKEYIEEQNKEIECLSNKLEIANNKLNMIKDNAQILTPNELLEIIENYTGFFGKRCD